MKFGCKMIRRDRRNSAKWSEEMVETVIFDHEPSLWPWPLRQQIKLFARQSGPWWSIITISSLNIKGWAVQKILPGQNLDTRTDGHWFQYTDSFNCITLFIGDTSNQCSRLWLERTLEQRYTSAIIQDCRSSWCNEHAAVIQTELLSHLAQQVVCTLVSKHIRLITHSQHHFPAPSSKLCQI